ncbi:hypothetical protein AVEN_133834-1 [Araneus ventricosus]|uniref:Uncharacterized protein n=1 Tax=Araneus ventricosus TaxID=182803 RepID=A0A4Y2I7D8_ARAVE|nr:hypothetical protein AVEN_133834-1 [Araneus ventricosus]
MSIDEDIPVAVTQTGLEIWQAVCEKHHALNVDNSDGDECVEENTPTNAEIRQEFDIFKRGEMSYLELLNHSNMSSSTLLAIQETQQALLQNPSRQLNWIKTHVSFLGTEAADNIAKQAAKEGTPSIFRPEMSSENA